MFILHNCVTRSKLYTPQFDYTSETTATVSFAQYDRKSIPGPSNYLITQYTYQLCTKQNHDYT